MYRGIVDGSGWESVYRISRKKGYNVSVVQNPTISLADDVAMTKRVAQPDAVASLVAEAAVGSASTGSGAASGQR